MSNSNRRYRTPRGVHFLPDGLKIDDFEWAKNGEMSKSELNRWLRNAWARWARVQKQMDRERWHRATEIAKIVEKDKREWAMQEESGNTRDRSNCERTD